MPKKAKEPEFLRDEKSGRYYVSYWDKLLQRTRNYSFRTTDETAARIRYAAWLVLYAQGGAGLPIELKDEAGAVELVNVPAYDPKKEISRAEGDRLPISHHLNYYQDTRVNACDSTGKPYVSAPEAQNRFIEYIRGYFGDKLPDQLTQADFDDYAIYRDIAPSTARRELGALFSALNHASKKGRLGVYRRPDLPPEAQGRERWLTVPEIERLLKAAEQTRFKDGRLSRTERFLWIALETGARKEAIHQLQWSQVDWKTKIIDMRTIGKRQTKKKQVVLPISKRLYPILHAAYQEKESDLWVLDYPGHCRKGIAKAAKIAKIAGVAPHVLRHTAGTQMARNGVELWKISGVLGCTLKTAEKHYLHHCVDRLRQAIDYDRV